MKILRSLLPHMLIIVSGIFIVFLVLDWFNPTMNFINNPVTMKLLWIFCILAIAQSTVAIASNRKKWKAEAERNNNGN